MNFGECWLGRRGIGLCIVCSNEILYPSFKLLFISTKNIRGQFLAEQGEFNLRIMFILGTETHKWQCFTRAIDSLGGGTEVDTEEVCAQPSLFFITS